METDVHGPPSKGDVGAGSEPAWHALPAGEAVALIQADAERGLSGQEIARRLARFGPNELPEAARRSLMSVLLHQFTSPLIYLLLAASGIALALGKVSDSIVILVVVLLNALIGAFQEGRAERSLDALRRLGSPKAHVLREGEEQLVEARELVPGDILLLAAGDAVVADARLLEGAALQLSEGRSVSRTAQIST
jgi:magnesium-transporting ATPase (P-type)